ncbi:MAG TPA: cob(I)yrinic acid a,c-diamide adenosyltransferase [Puia sp.]|jgi:cob(I)alamin adenosyltransferase|nr:cob(I)yrinic acid a,c-diamide adenosyltransferase [Puia sp.]
MASKIYTKTGDKGTTSLFGGTKVPKSHLRIEAYGTVDELNSFMGLLSDHLASAASNAAILASISHSENPAFDFDETGGQLHEIQDRLLTIGSLLATEKETKYKLPDLLPDDIQNLENAIDDMDAVLPHLKSFVLPGGHIAVSTAHITRCVCRRAERCCVRLQEEGAALDPLIIQYLNRLSDYLFTIARFAAHRLQIHEIPWTPRK